LSTGEVEELGPRYLTEAKDDEKEEKDESALMDVDGAAEKSEAEGEKKKDVEVASKIPVGLMFRCSKCVSSFSIPFFSPKDNYHLSHWQMQAYRSLRLP
jgi:hypothetical protein